jgi:hypothetical protein
MRRLEPSRIVITAIAPVSRIREGPKAAFAG